MPPACTIKEEVLRTLLKGAGDAIAKESWRFSENSEVAEEFASFLSACGSCTPRVPKAMLVSNLRKLFDLSPEQATGCGNRLAEVFSWCRSRARNSAGAKLSPGLRQIVEAMTSGACKPGTPCKDRSPGSSSTTDISPADKQEQCKQQQQQKRQKKEQQQGPAWMKTTAEIYSSFGLKPPAGSGPRSSGTMAIMDTEVYEEEASEPAEAVVVSSSSEFGTPEKAKQEQQEQQQAVPKPKQEPQQQQKPKVQEKELQDLVQFPDSKNLQWIIIHTSGDKEVCPLAPGPEGFLLGPGGQRTELPNLLLLPRPAMVLKRPAAAPGAAKRKKQSQVEDLPDEEEEDEECEKEEAGPSDEDEEGEEDQGEQPGKPAEEVEEEEEELEGDEHRVPPGFVPAPASLQDAGCKAKAKAQPKGEGKPKAGVQAKAKGKAKGQAVSKPPAKAGAEPKAKAKGKALPAPKGKAKGKAEPLQARANIYSRAYHKARDVAKKDQALSKEEVGRLARAAGTAAVAAMAGSA